LILNFYLRFQSNLTRKGVFATTFMVSEVGYGLLSETKSLTVKPDAADMLRRECRDVSRTLVICSCCDDMMIL